MTGQLIIRRRASREEAERVLADANEFLQAIKALFENPPPSSGT